MTTTEVQRRFLRVWDIQKLLGYDKQPAARRLLERLHKKGVIHLRKVGHSIFVLADEIYDLFGIKDAPIKTPAPEGERAVG